MIDNKHSYSAEIVNINGVEHLRDTAGVIISKPYEDYCKEFDEVKYAISEVFPELRRYLNMLVPVFTFRFSTFATGYGYIFMNPYFFDKLIAKNIKDRGEDTHELLMFVIMHEIYHNLYSHMADGARNESLYPDATRRNVAMDYTINWVIEQLYFSDYPGGVVTRAGGLISDTYAGWSWQEVYKTADAADAAAKQVPFVDADDPYNKVKWDDEPDDENNDGGMPQSPQNANVKYSEDYKQGYASMYDTIKKVVEDARDEIRSHMEKGESLMYNGKEVDEITYIVDSLKDAALLMGIQKDKIFESIMQYPSANAKYNAGVEQAWVNAIKKIRDLRAQIKNSSNSDYSGSDTTNYEDKLKDAIDDLYKDLDSGGQSSKSNDDNKDSSDQSNDDNKDNKDNKDNNSKDNSSSSNNNSKGGKGQSGQLKPIDPNSCSEAEKDRVMKELIKERELEPEDDNEREESKARALQKHLEKLPTETDDANRAKKIIEDDIDRKFPIKKVNSGVNWKEKIEEFVVECQKEDAKTFNIDSVAKTIPFYRSNKVIFSEDTTRDTAGSNHIVIGLDNSGSVCSSGSVPDFLGALLEIFDSALDGDVAVDVIQFDHCIEKCTRLIHLSEQSEEESVKQVEEVATATNGGTDYTEVMKEAELLTLNFDEDNDTVLDDVSIAKVFRDTEFEGTYDNVTIMPATCTIIFTDTDFYNCPKYLNMDPSMYDRMLFVILSTKTEDEHTDDNGYRILEIKRELWEYDNRK